jgi:hypothetical protein
VGALVSDATLRALARAAASGDPEAEARLARERARQRVSYRLVGDPSEPECEGDEHDWTDTGDVQAHGGGVTYNECCPHCAWVRSTDTWAQRPDTGEQGLTSVSYTREEDEDQSDYLDGPGSRCEW